MLEDARRRGLDPGVQHAHRRASPVQALADLMTLREAFGRARWSASSPTSATATTSRARSRSLGGSPASTCAVASPDGLRARAHRRRALDRDPPRPSPARTPSTPTCGSRWATRTPPTSAAPRSAAYRIDDALLDRAAPGAIALHCLPAHPGEEITAEVLYGDRQRIWDQAENRRHAQKALLELLVAAG